MFNKKLKEKIRELEREVERLYANKFRVGDKVYINDGKFNPTEPFYLAASYNGGDNYYVTADEGGEAIKASCLAVHVSNISHEKPHACHCCGNLINQTEKTK